MIEGDAGEAVTKERHLLIPRKVIAARAVAKDDRRPGPVRLVIEIGPLVGK
jgi:hypothetical protein